MKRGRGCAKTLGCLLLASAAFAFVLTTARAGPYEDGVAANGSGQYALAMQLWRPLAEQGDADAQFALAAMYELGRGVSRDKLEALKWFRRAAEQGDAGAQFAVASAYAAGEIVPKDYGEATKWFLRTANQGDIFAQIALAGAYAQGLGVQKDMVEALKWLDVAAAANGLNGKAAESRDAFAHSLTPAQVDEAQRRAAEWKLKPERPPR